jgi:hypothetical protein
MDDFPRELYDGGSDDNSHRLHLPHKRYNNGELKSGTRFRYLAHLAAADGVDAKYQLSPIVLWTDNCAPDFKRPSQA